MIVLDTTTKSLEVLLAGAVATTQLPIVACWVDVTTTTFLPGEADTATNNATAVTAIAAPAASTQRQGKLVTVFNADTAAATVTVRVNNNGTFRTLVKVTLAVGSTLIYPDGEGWRVIDATGGITSTTSPTAHAPTHKACGNDSIKLDELAAPTDITTLNVSTTAHGLAPKLPNDATKFFNGTGGYTTPSSGTWTVISNTDTGAQNNWAPAGLSGNTLIEWNGAADIAPTGLAGGTAGQLVTIRNVTAAKIATFAHASASSSAANRFTNYATSAATPVAPGGTITYQHDGTNWQIVGHNQGAWIDVAYTAGDFTASGAMTWTVESTDLKTFHYRLAGTTLEIDLVVETSTTGGTPDNALQVKVPGGFTPAGASGKGQFTEVYMLKSNGGAYTFDGMWNAGSGGTNLLFYRGGFGGGTWANGTNNNAVYVSTRLQVN